MVVRPFGNRQNIFVIVTVKNSNIAMATVRRNEYSSLPLEGKVSRNVTDEV